MRETERCELRILAIEDDADTREMYARMLRDEGHEAIPAADVLRTLKADPTARAIPVVVVSASRFDLPLLPAMLALVGG